MHIVIDFVRVSQCKFYIYVAFKSETYHICPSLSVSNIRYCDCKQANISKMGFFYLLQSEQQIIALGRNEAQTLILVCKLMKCPFSSKIVPWVITR